VHNTSPARLKVASGSLEKGNEWLTHRDVGMSGPVPPSPEMRMAKDVRPGVRQCIATAYEAGGAELVIECPHDDDGEEMRELPDTDQQLTREDRSVSSASAIGKRPGVIEKRCGRARRRRTPWRRTGND